MGGYEGSAHQDLWTGRALGGGAPSWSAAQLLAAAGALAEARGPLRDLRWADERQVQALDAGEREWSRRAETAVNELVGRGLVQESRLRAVRRRAEGGAASRDLGHRDAVGRTARSLGKVRGERALRRQEERGGGS